MIKRLHGRKSHGTLVANPRRRKKRSGSKRRVKRSASALFANPRRRKKRRNPGSLSGYLKKHNARRKSHKRRNPSFVRELDLVTVGIGAVAAIGLSSVGQGIVEKYMGDTFADQPAIKAALPSLIVAGAAFAAHKYMKNAKIKQVAKYTLVMALYKAVDDAVGGKIKESVKGILPGNTSGAYLPALRGYTSGAYMDATGGAYLHTSGALLPSGGGLYGL